MHRSSSKQIPEEARPWIRGGELWPRSLRLARPQRREIAAWASDSHPREACGLLLGRHHGPQEGAGSWTEVVRVASARNLERARGEDHFTLAPEDWLAIEQGARRAGLEVVGIWHSHPDQPARPSTTDLAAAWEGYAYLIVGTRSGIAHRWRSWQLEGEHFVEQAIEDDVEDIEEIEDIEDIEDETREERKRA